MGKHSKAPKGMRPGIWSKMTDQEKADWFDENIAQAKDSKPPIRIGPMDEAKRRGKHKRLPWKR